MPVIGSKRSPEPDLPGRYFATGLLAFLLFAAGVPCVDLVWEPRWVPEMMTDRAKRELGWM